MSQAEEALKALSEIEKSTLVILVHSCDHSVNAHVPVEAVSKKFPKHLRGEIKSQVKNLVREGFAYLHPTGRNKTYGVTRFGLEVFDLIFQDC